jgi:MFS transporter, MHS family, proline/betaine transporter
VIGGLTPLVASWLVARTGNEIAPGLLMMVAAAVTFLTILRFPETYRIPLSDSASSAAAAYT